MSLTTLTDRIILKKILCQHSHSYVKFVLVLYDQYPVVMASYRGNALKPFGTFSFHLLIFEDYQRPSFIPTLSFFSPVIIFLLFNQPSYRVSKVITKRLWLIPERKQEFFDIIIPSLNFRLDQSLRKNDLIEAQYSSKSLWKFDWSPSLRARGSTT